MKDKGTDGSTPRSKCSHREEGNGGTGRRLLACHDCYGKDKVPSVPRFADEPLRRLTRTPDDLAATDRISGLGKRLRVPRRRVF